MVTIAIVLALVAAAVIIWVVRRNPAAQVSQVTGTVSRQTVRTTVGASGTIEPAQQADVSFPSGGTVRSVEVAVGDTVTKGQALATIDPAALQAAVETAQAQLAAADSQLTTLQDQGADSTRIAAAQAEIAVDQAQLTQADSQLAGATLRAPFAGTVAAVTIAVGDSTGSGGSGGGKTVGSGGAGGANGSGAAGTTAAGTSSSADITVISTDTFVMDATVTTADQPELRKGMQAQIVPSGSATTVYGTVATIGVTATTSSDGSAGVPVTIQVTGTQKGLFAGSAATATIIVAERPDVLTVPTAAIRSFGGASYVEVDKLGTTTRVPITIGTSYGPLTEVTSGVTAGETVVITTRTVPSGAASAGIRTRSGSGRGGFGGGGFGGSGGARGGQNAAGGQGGR